MDSSILRVPTEQLRVAAKEYTKRLGGEVEAALAALRSAADGNAPDADALQALEARLQELQAPECLATENAALLQCRERAAHCSAVSSTNDVRSASYAQLDRLLVDHLFRTGHHEVALLLARETGTLQLVDAGVYEAARAVEASLLRRDCGQALEWCAANRSKLKRIQSKLEFSLHLQCFVGLIRVGDAAPAVAYAREHLAPWAPTRLKELQQAMALLAFCGRCGGAEAGEGEDALPSRYEQLLSDSRWAQLAAEFRADLAQLSRLSPQSVLVTYLQAGLAALNTPHIERDAAGVSDDPLAYPVFQRLAAGLPYAKHIHSSWVCPLTKAIMDENNPPMVLPNGYVYSKQALDEMAAQNNGLVMCVRTGEGPFELSSAAKVFLA